MDAVLALRLLSELHRNFNRETWYKVCIWFCRQGSTMEGTTRVWYATISSSTYPWLPYRNNCSGSHSSGYVRCVLHNIRSPSRLYTRSCAFFAVQLIGSCDTVLVVLEFTLAISISPISTTLMTQSLLPMIQRNVTMFFEILGHQQVLWVNTNWHKTKIQNIGTGEWRCSKNSPYWQSSSRDSIQVHLYLGSDINSEGYFYPEIHRRLGIAGSIMAQLDNFGRQQKLSLSTKLRIYTWPLLCSR